MPFTVWIKYKEVPQTVITAHKANVWKQFDQLTNTIVTEQLVKNVLNTRGKTAGSWTWHV